MFKHATKVPSIKRSTAFRDKAASEASHHSDSEEYLKNILISCSLADNMANIQGVIGKNVDLVSREITLGRKETRPAATLYFDNLINPELLDNDILRPLLLDAYTSGLSTSSEIIHQIQTGNMLTRAETKTATTLLDLLNGLLLGEVILLIDGVPEAYIISIKGYRARSIGEADNEPVVRGSKEAFNEVISFNIGMLRRRLHSPNLIIEALELGTVSKTKVCVAYLKGLCLPGLAACVVNP